MPFTSSAVQASCSTLSAVCPCLPKLRVGVHALLLFSLLFTFPTNVQLSGISDSHDADRWNPRALSEN